MGFGFSGTREVYEEGLQFRSLKLYRGEQPNQEIFQIITDNVRFAESSLGDLRAQIAACRVGDRGLGALVRRYGSNAFLQCVRDDLAAVRSSGAGTSRAHQAGQVRSRSVCSTATASISTQPVPLKVKVEVAGSDMTIDFSEISEQVAGSINSGESGAVAAARVAFKSLVSPYSPIDEGCFRALKVIIPPGKILERDAAVTGGQLEPHLADGDRFDSQSAGAGDARTSCGGSQRRHGRLCVLRRQSENRQTISLPDDHGRRLGRASRTKTARTPPCRCAKATCKTRRWSCRKFTIRCVIERQQLREGSGGGGKFRGGLGIEVAVRVLCDASTNINVERQRTRALGIVRRRMRREGESVGQTIAGRSRRVADEETELSAKAGGSVTFYTAGGGGYGAVDERAWRID